MTHICVGNLTIIGPDNGLSPGRRQAIIWTNAGILLIGPRGTNFSEILIGIHTFSFKKIHLNMSSAKWRPFCFSLNVLNPMASWCRHMDTLVMWHWYYPWWRHQMETFSAFLALCAGNSPITGKFPSQRPVMRRFDIFFHLCLNKHLSKQSWGWWFETPSRPLWHHLILVLCVDIPQTNSQHKGQVNV